VFAGVSYEVCVSFVQPVFICYDTDFFDPSVAPGVGMLTPEGTMQEEGHELMRGLKGLSIIDINTMTPLHDAGGATAILAVCLLAESLVTLS
jgi:arginase family enzyme